MTIILCGMPMSGKSTIGKRLAKKLGWKYIDTDRLVENAYMIKTGKKSICRQIYLDDGEALFRQIEKEQISSLKEIKECVIALGGGSLIDPDNVRSLKEIGSIIYLKTPVSIIWQRMVVNGIPPFLNRTNPEKALQELAEKRKLIYEQAADVVIETLELSEQEVIEAILQQREVHNGK